MLEYSKIRLYFEGTFLISGSGCVRATAMQNILIIDDSEFDRRMIVSAMKSTCEDITCFELSHGEKALEMMRRESPELTIVDIRMPGLSGWEVLDQIKADKDLCDLNVIMMSGSHSGDDIKMASEKGADGFYTKPNSQLDYHSVAADLKNTYFNTAA